MELDQYSTASGHQSVSIGRNYEMQFPAILAPALLGGAPFTIRNADPLCHYVLFVF
jgi:hypothetical protein